MKLLKKKFSFSKVVIGFLVGTYFFGLALGTFVVIRILIINPESAVQALIALLSYIGAVNGISIPFYLTTKRDENLQKYPDIQTIEDFKAMNNIGSGMSEDISEVNKNNE